MTSHAGRVGIAICGLAFGMVLPTRHASSGSVVTSDLAMLAPITSLTSTRGCGSDSGRAFLLGFRLIISRGINRDLSEL